MLVIIITMLVTIYGHISYINGLSPELQYKAYIIISAPNIMTAKIDLTDSNA